MGQPAVHRAAQASRDAAVVAEGVAQPEADEAVGSLGALLQAVQEFRCLHKGILAVVIVGVDDRKAPMEHSLAAQQRVAGAPGLDPLCGAHKAAGEIFLLLIGAEDLHTLLRADRPDPVTYDPVEQFLNIMTDNKNHPVKTSFHGIVYGIIHNDLPAGADALQLLHAAGKPGANARRQDHQGSFLFHDDSHSSPALRVFVFLVYTTYQQNAS